MNRKCRTGGCALNFEAYTKCKDRKGELPDIDLWLQKNMAWVGL